MQKNTEELSGLIYALKGLAIMIVVSAHSTLIPQNAPWLLRHLDHAWIQFSQLGVPLFFIISGFLYNDNYTLKDIFRKKTSSIIIPWFFSGALMYLYIFSRRDFGPNPFLWVLGYKSHLYFLFCLFIIFITFSAIKNKPLRIGLLSLSVASNLFTFFYLKSNGNEYLDLLRINPLNWCLLFASGLWIKKHSDLIWLKQRLRLIRPFLILFFILLFALFFSTQVELGFQVPYFIPIALLFFCLAVSLSDSLILNNSVMKNIGRLSFSIYLIHLPAIGLASHLDNKFTNGWLLPIRFLVATLIASIALKIYMRILEKTKYSAFFYKLMGLR